MVKKLTKKFKDIKVAITFAEPREYDIKSEAGRGGKDALRKRTSSTKKKRRSPRAKSKN